MCWSLHLAVVPRAKRSSAQRPAGNPKLLQNKPSTLSQQKQNWDLKWSQNKKQRKEQYQARSFENVTKITWRSNQPLKLDSGTKSSLPILEFEYLPSLVYVLRRTFQDLPTKCCKKCPSLLDSLSQPLGIRPSPCLQLREDLGKLSPLNVKWSRVVVCPRLFPVASKTKPYLTCLVWQSISFDRDLTAWVDRKVQRKHAMHND